MEKSSSLKSSGALQKGLRFPTSSDDEERKGGRKLEITGPVNVVHKLHVDKELNWTGSESAKSVEILEKLGEGAYGAVFRALHLPTNFVLAVKTVPISENNEQSSDIKKEIEILKQCRHDNIVSLYGCMFHENKLWIMMDFCGAGSVKDFVKHWTRPLLEEEIVAIMYYVLGGLDYLHSKSIIHRDLKSANILLTDKGEVKIADFGVSFQVNNTLAKANTVIGTPLFMAPEALAASNYSEKADIWSLAITAIEMVEGVPPYNDEHIMRAMLLIAQSDPPTLKEPEKMSPEFNAFLARCLKKDPAERPSAMELLTDPLFQKRNQEEALRSLMAEVRINKLNKRMEESAAAKAAAEEESASASETETNTQEKSEDNDDVDDSSEAEDPRRRNKGPRLLNPILRSSAHASKLLGLNFSQKELGTELGLETTIKRGAEWAPDTQEAIRTIEALMESLLEEYHTEQVLVEEMDYYSSMSFAQLVTDIEELKETSKKLEKKIAHYQKKLEQK